MKSGPRPDITRALIATTALAVLDEEGERALTLREVARRLDVKASSIYNHVRSKAEILELVTELISGDTDPALLEDGDWRQGMRAFALSYRKAFLDHPNATAVIARRTVSAPSSLRYYTEAVVRLTGAGWSHSEALEIVLAVDYLVMGSVMVPFSAGFARAPESYRPEYEPLARAVEETDPDAVDERVFTSALDRYLDALGDPPGAP
ncbi:TetR/AcrR family transcriptional regulator [Nocardiopsis salina]|uniref:TetR/AcrR family transcriptional regulator n=1 Tax=Nocardiopsis salina TaxID=245836 RepID=UPI000349148F|nr:TetR/AcrR family transcriptional regulator C-terminal domain-containing protein [Nocardiopsis salina]